MDKPTPIAAGDPPDPDQAGFAGTVYMVQVCKQHDPDPRRSLPIRILPIPYLSANVRDDKASRRGLGRTRSGTRTPTIAVL